MTTIDSAAALDGHATRRTPAPGDEPGDGPPPLNLARELFGGRVATVVLIGILMVVSVVATLVLPLLVGDLIDAVQHRGPVAATVAAMVAVGLGAAAAGALSANLLARLGHGLVLRLRLRIIDHALRMRLADVQAEGRGNLTSRLTSDALQLMAAVELVPVQLPMALLTLLGTVVIMSLIDGVLLLVTLAGFAVALSLVSAVVVALRSRYRTQQEKLGALAEQFGSALEALTVIKSTRSESRQSAELARVAGDLRRTGTETALLESFVVPSINLGQQIALLAVLVGGSARLLAGELTVAEFVAFLIYLLQLTSPLVLAASGVSVVQAGLVAKGRFDSVLAMPPESADTLAGRATSRPAGLADHRFGGTDAVELCAVTAGYSAGPPALQDVSFRVPAVGLTALVGPSGSGKTTVLRLIERLIVARSGVVRVDDHDVRAVDLHRHRSRMVYVDQEYTLVAGTVRANLELGTDRSTTDAELWAALATVGMDAEVLAMPEGLDTVLPARGGLSGGQCQRLALARAVLSDVPLILLDEPTSALDAANENRLRAVVDELARDRAVLVVAHRISTVRAADHVVVLDRGRVRAQGTHTALLSGGGLYAELVRFQLVEPDREVP